MRRSHFFAPTLKETPTDATATSHKLMLRAGLIRMLAAGVYSYLPLGWRAATKASQIVREEQDEIGGQEFFLPVLNPIEVWEETGRAQDFGSEMFRLKDRKDRSYCLAPTHEEIICSIARGELRSWRDLPQMWYQIQMKFRDEPRPRGGLLRIRQFLMMDAYSLDRDEEGLDKSYERQRQAYIRTFERCGFDYYIVQASSGLMGGSQSEEFMVDSDAGEDTVARCTHCGYAANLEVATSSMDKVENGPESTLTDVATPGKRTVEDVSAFLNIPPSRLVKTLIYAGSAGPVIALIAGDDELSEAKLTRVVGSMIRPAHPEEVKEWMNADVGYLGPQGDRSIPIYADLRLEDAKGLVSGANRNGYHVIGLEFGRDVQPDSYLDLRVARDGEACPVCGQSLKLKKSIELGHIFKLGTKYSAAMGATFLDEAGVEKPIVMGSYGIGIERIVASAVEANADKDGIRWNSALTPFDVNILAIGGNDETVTTAAEALYKQLLEDGFEVLLDDRDARPGVKMKDADLIGIPVQIVVSARNMAEGKVEVKNRWTGERTFVTTEEVSEAIEKILEECEP